MLDVKKSYVAHSVNEALELLYKYPDSIIVSGGTDVLISVRGRKIKEPILISLLEVEEIKNIELKENGDIEIGSGVTHDDIYKNDIIRKYIPYLGFACNNVGSPQIRHIATIGGNVCNGAVSGDSAPSLFALNAKLVLVGQTGEEIVPIEKFYLGPGKTISKRDRKILKKIIISKEDYEGFGGYYIKNGQRRAMEISTLGCTTCIKMNNNKIEDIRIAYGVAAPVPIRVKELEKYMIGKDVNEDLLNYVEDHVLDELSPRDSWRASLVLREQLIKVSALRTIKGAIKDLNRRWS